MGLLLVLALISLGLGVLGLGKSRQGKAFELVWWLFPWGAFVWGDIVVFGPFLGFVLTICFFLQDCLLLALLMSIFWLVRSLGETIYWFNQQFTSLKRNPPQKMPGYTLFKNDAIWFVYQIVWQCITVITIFTTVWFFKLWLN